jgi:hypothetical protein
MNKLSLQIISFLSSHDASLLMLVMEFDGNYEIVIFFIKKRKREGEKRKG